MHKPHTVDDGGLVVQDADVRFAFLVRLCCLPLVLRRAWSLQTATRVASAHCWPALSCPSQYPNLVQRPFALFCDDLHRSLGRMRGRKQSAVGQQRDPAGEVSDSAVPIDRFWCCGGAVEPLVAASRMRGRKESTAGQRRDPAGEVSISVATSDRSWCCEELRILSWPPPWLAISRATSSPTFIRTMAQAPLPIVVPPLAVDRAES